MKKLLLLLILVCSGLQIKSDPYTYDLIIVAGQDNAGRTSFSCSGTSSGLQVWNVNTFKMNTAYSTSQCHSLFTGTMCFLITKLKAAYPSKNFVFLHYGVTNTYLASQPTQFTTWTPKSPYSLFMNLAAQIWDIIVIKGQPSSIQFIWIQGENDNGVIKTSYYTPQKNLYDTLPVLIGTPLKKWKFYTYLPKSQSDTTFCNTVNSAKKSNAILGTNVYTFSVDVGNYVASSSNIVVQSGISVMADTLMANFARHGF